MEACCSLHSIENKLINNIEIKTHCLKKASRTTARKLLAMSDYQFIEIYSSTDDDSIVIINEGNCKTNTIDKKVATESTPRKRSPKPCGLLPASGNAGLTDLTGNLSDGSSADSYHCLVKKSNDLIELNNEKIARSERILSSFSRTIPL